MTSYRRPAIAPLVFRDGDGRVIDYGDRWGTGSPPEDSYSAVHHPERFAPLHAVADALVSHLREMYAVDVVDSTDIAADLARTPAVRAIRMVPGDPACATLTFVYTAFPGIVLRAGLIHTFTHPVCGCDACDETWETQADELERTVLAVVGGRYRESVGRGPGAWVEHELTFPDGMRSGRSPVRDLSEEQRRMLPELRRRGGSWAPWPAAATPTPPRDIRRVSE